MKSNGKTSSQLITDQTDTPQANHALSPEDLKKLAAFISLLATIDRRNKNKERRKENQL